MLFYNKDWGLWFGVEYQALNIETANKWCSIHLILASLNWLGNASIVSTFDHWTAYSPIWINEGDKVKITLQILYGQFELWVMHIALKNALVTFHLYIDNWLQPYIDDFGVCYIEDILIDLINEKEHKDHSRIVLQSLQVFRRDRWAEKWQFGDWEVGCLRSVIYSDGSSLESNRVSKSKELPTADWACEVDMILCFPFLYWKLILKYWKVSPPRSNWLKTQSSWQWEWVSDAKLAFWNLQWAITDARILQDFNSQKPNILQSTVSNRSG